MATDLSQRIKQARRQAGLTQKRLADHCGVSKSAVAQWEAEGRNVTKPELHRLQLIAQATGVTVDWLLGNGSEAVDAVPIVSAPGGPPASERADYEAAPWLRCVCSTEYAFLPNYEGMAHCDRAEARHPVAVSGALAFKAGWLEKIGAEKGDITVIYSRGHSMWPTIGDGEALLIHRRETVPKTGEIYAIQRAGTCDVRRLIDHWSYWLVRSDNPDKSRYPDVPVPTDDLPKIGILGRIVWRGGRL